MSGIKIKFKDFYGRTSFVILFGIEHKNPIVVPHIFAFYFLLLFATLSCNKCPIINHVACCCFAIQKLTNSTRLGV